LHFSHMGLTEGRTFTLVSLSSIGSTMFRRPGSGDRVGRRYRTEEFTHAAQIAPQAHTPILAGEFGPGLAATASFRAAFTLAPRGPETLPACRT